MAGSTGRKTVGVSRGLMMLCESCYTHVVNDKLPDAKNFVEKPLAAIELRRLGEGRIYAGRGVWGAGAQAPCTRLSNSRLEKGLET